MGWQVQLSRRAGMNAQYEVIDVMFQSEEKEPAQTFFRGVMRGLALAGLKTMWKPENIVEFSPGDGFRYKVSAVITKS